jgi:hypothetical protein
MRALKKRWPYLAAIILVLGIAIAVAWRTRAGQSPDVSFLDKYETRELRVTHPHGAPGFRYRLLAFPAQNYRSVLNQMALYIIPQALDPAYRPNAAARLRSMTDTEAIAIDGGRWQVRLFPASQSVKEAKSWTDDRVSAKDCLLMVVRKPVPPPSLWEQIKDLLHIPRPQSTE